MEFSENIDNRNIWLYFGGGRSKDQSRDSIKQPTLLRNLTLYILYVVYCTG